MRPSIRHLSLFFLIAFGALALTTAYWTTIERDNLLTRPDNPRTLINYNRIQRGRILDREGEVLTQSLGTVGNYQRQAEISAALVTGYASFRYGLSGIEAAQNATLNGEETDSVINWWRHDLLGEPQIGRDVRLTLSASLQQAAYALLAQNKKVGAVVILNKQGEVFALASYPSFDPATLEKDFPRFSADDNGPLLNRAVYALYPTGGLINLFPATLTLNEPPPFVLPTRAEDRNKTTPLQVALLATATLNNGVMPAPQLLIPTVPAREVAVMPPATAQELRAVFRAGYVMTLTAINTSRTQTWYVQTFEDKVLCVLLEDGSAVEAWAFETLLSNWPK